MGYWGEFRVSLPQRILLTESTDRLNLQNDLRKSERRGVHAVFLQTLQGHQLAGVASLLAERTGNARVGVPWTEAVGGTGGQKS